MSMANSNVTVIEGLGPALPNSRSAAKTSPMAVVIKGLPADHPLSKYMGEYVEQAEQYNARPLFLGGRCNDMELSFSNIGWEVQGDYEGGWATFLYSLGTETLPHLVTSGWAVCEQRKDPSSVRVEKFKKRETMLKLSGGQGSRYGAVCEGVYRKQDRIHDDKPTYINGNTPTYQHIDCSNLAIWFTKGYGWCVGIEEMIGTRSCMIHADDFAPTPDAVRSGWMVRMDYVKDSRVQVVLASAECTPSPLGQQQTPTPVSANIPSPEQELRSAPENTPPPLTIAVVGVGEGFSGLYEKQQHLHAGKVLYEGSRADGNRVIFHSDEDDGRWRIGPVGSNGAWGCSISTNSSAASPHTLGAVWGEYAIEPCNSARVTKSKKKHTKVIEVKGVPAHQGHPAFAQMNGKYRQQALKIDGRPTFKGGDGGNQAIWYSESTGSWRAGRVIFVGTASHLMSAKDTASMPNTIKSTWEILKGTRVNPYAKIILPTVEAAVQEVPRQMQLKMAEVLAAEQKRCLGCGYQYTLQTEVVFHDECMHHHCICCGDEEGSDACAVCAADDGSDSCGVCAECR
jgi:hypothetical protein